MWGRKYLCIYFDNLNVILLTFDFLLFLFVLHSEWKIFFFSYVYYYFTILLLIFVSGMVEKHSDTEDLLQSDTGSILRGGRNGVYLETPLSRLSNHHECEDLGKQSIIIDLLL